MTNKEKVLAGLMACGFHADCEDCPYCDEMLCSETLHKDCYELIVSMDLEESHHKKHKPVEPVIVGDKTHYGAWYYSCPDCEKPINFRDRYCSRCGVAFKWKE